MQIERFWAMPSLWTFSIPPIKTLLAEEANSGLWCDPFSGKNSFAQYTNDLTEKSNNLFSEHKNMDALDYLKTLEPSFFDGVLYDPPYSITQARNYGAKKYASMKYWKEVKDELARILKPHGKAICFGWSSSGLGKSRGFEMKRCLLVCHGGSKNDTIVTVELKKEEL